MAEGWIKLHRKIQDSDIWTMGGAFDMRSAWIDLLMMANHDDRETIIDYKKVIIKRGQFVTSVRKLSQRWEWCNEKTLKFLRLLEAMKMIHKESNNRRTLITIENYEVYQCEPNTKRTQNDTQNSTQSERNTNAKPPQTRNIKNDKNEKNIYISSFDEFWKCYPRKQDKGQAYKCYLARLNDGYSEEQLLTACKNYAAECEKNRTEQRYIKHGSTFLSVNEPFLDYLKGEEHGSVGRISTNDEEQRNREIDEHYKRAQAGEFDAEDEELRRIWDS